MSFLWPGSLLGLLAVTAAAAWALYRPGRQQHVAPSLSLWTQALQSLDARRRRATRRLSPAWVCLLTGAVLAVLAMARPVIHTRARARRVAISVYPSAEIDPAQLTRATDALLARFAPDDQIQLLLPQRTTAPTAWGSPDEARRRLQTIAPVAIPAEKMNIPAPDPTVQHVYHLAAAGAPIPAGPGNTWIPIPSATAAVTIDAIDARPLDDGTVQLFIALQNQSPDRTQQAALEIRSWPDSSDASAWATVTRSLAAGPGKRVETVVEIPAAAAVEVRLGPDAPGSRVFLVRRDARMRRVALVGADWPMARRFITVDPMLDLVARPAEANVVIVNRAAAPAGTPALIVNPTGNPPGYTRVENVAQPAVPARRSVPDDLVTRGVDFTPLAVRSVQPWQARDTAMGKVLLARGDHILILRNDPDTSGVARPRRVYLAFDPADENTNFCATEGFVVFMANAMRWLAPGGRSEVRYESLTPDQIGPLGGAWVQWGGAATDPDALPWPGLYRNTATGDIEAVNLTGLRRQPAPADAVASIRELKLPPAQLVADNRELMTILTILAGGLWLIGWRLRTGTL